MTFRKYSKEQIKGGQAVRATDEGGSTHNVEAIYRRPRLLYVGPTPLPPPPDDQWPTAYYQRWPYAAGSGFQVVDTASFLPSRPDIKFEIHTCFIGVHLRNGFTAASFQELEEAQTQAGVQLRYRIRQQGSEGSANWEDLDIDQSQTRTIIMPFWPTDRGGISRFLLQMRQAGLASAKGDIKEGYEFPYREGQLYPEDYALMQWTITEVELQSVVDTTVPLRLDTEVNLIGVTPQWGSSEDQDLDRLRIVNVSSSVYGIGLDETAVPVSFSALLEGSSSLESEIGTVPPIEYNVHIGDAAGSSRVGLVKYDAGGDVEWTFTGHTSNINRVTTDPDGFVYSAGLDRFRKLDSDGNQLWETSINNVQSVAVAGDGFIYTTHNNGMLRKWTSGGSQVLVTDFWPFSTGTVIAWDVVVDTDFIYVGNQDGIVRKLDFDANVIWTFNEYSGQEARRLTVDGDGFVYVAHNTASSRRIVKIDPDGNEVTTGAWPYEGFSSSQIRGLDVGQDGYLYASNLSGNLARKLDTSDASVIWTYTASTSVPDVCVDPQGFVYLAKGANVTGWTLMKLDPNGNEVWERGIAGNTRPITVSADPGRYAAFPAEW